MSPERQVLGKQLAVPAGSGRPTGVFRNFRIVGHSKLFAEFHRS